MTTRTLQQMIAQFPEHRAALKRLLLKELQQEFEAPEYAGDRAEVTPFAPSSDHIMRVISTLDDCLQQAEQMQEWLKTAPVGGAHWLLGDDTTLTSDNINDVFDRLSQHVFFADDSERDVEARLHWQDRIGAVSTLFDML